MVNPVPAPTLAITDAHVYCLPPQLRIGSHEIEQDNPEIIRAIHQHPDGAWVLPLSDPKEIANSMMRSGISRSILVSFPWATQRLCTENNSFVLAACDTDSRFRGICSIQPRDPGWRDEAARCAQNGAVGLKINGGWQGFDLDCGDMDAVADWAGRNQLFVMTHVDQAFRKSSNAAAQLLSLAERHPETKFLAAHLGGLLGAYAALPSIASRLDNIWFDTAVSATLYMVRMYVDVGLGKKLIFGSDYPFNHSHSQAQVLSGIRALGLAPDIERAILSENIEALVRK
jgi:predicted TIM-barrel fold metal-dependent hydrolase